MSAPRGAFILFEGADRCGKTTQSSKLVEYLKQKQVPVQDMGFPDRTSAIGKLLDGYLRSGQQLDDHAVHLLFSANRWELSAQMVSLLRAGTTLVVDRWAASGVAYSAAKRAPGMDAAWCSAPDAGLPAPDLVVYLSLPAHAQAARAGWGQERYEVPEFQSKVREQFEALRDTSWRELDASASVDDLHKQVVDAAGAAIAQCAAGAPLRRLWDGTLLEVHPPS